MKYNILYVDDESENLRSFRAFFRRDYDIFITESALKALEYLHDHNVDLIITDQRMPEMTGVEFLEKVFEFIPDKPPNRIILSGYSCTRDIDEAKKKYQLSLFVAKPWDPDDLKIKMDETIEQCNN